MNEQIIDSDTAVERALAAELPLAAINALLARLPEAGGPAGLVLDDHDSVATLVSNGRPITIAWQEGFPGITLSAPLCRVEGIPQDILRTLLAANGAWSISAGGVFGIAASGAPLSYARRVLLVDADPAACLRAIAAFVDYVNDWHARIELAADHQTAQATADAVSV